VNATTRTQPSWTAEEDDFLLKHASIYTHNWTLLADIIASLPHPPRDEKTAFDVYSRWDTLRKSSKEERKKEKSTAQKSERRGAVKHLRFFEAVAKVVKKRDGQKQQQQAEKGSLVAIHTCDVLLNISCFKWNMNFID
jgi:hypothetical protein